MVIYGAVVIALVVISRWRCVPGISWRGSQDAPCLLYLSVCGFSWVFSTVQKTVFCTPLNARFPACRAVRRECLSDLSLFLVGF